VGFGDALRGGAGVFADAKVYRADPIGFATGDYDLYRYCADRPLDYVDPYGLFSSENHRKQTEAGLANSGLSKACIKIIADADVAQDDGFVFNTPPFSDPLNHGDNGQLGPTISRIVQRWYSIAGTKKCDCCKDVHDSILKEFGKLLHAVQDLYAHSNYVETTGGGGANGTATMGSLPLWPMFGQPGNTPNVPAGLTSGNYVWHVPGARDPSPPPTHDQMNHDDAGTPAGEVKNKAGVSMFDLANDLATRHTTTMWNALSSQMAGNACWKKVLECCKKSE
jgi:hypothetical protein